MAEPFTYHDDGGDDLEPAEREVVCRYYLDAGPGHTEFVTQFLGPSECGRFDVLWEESDLTEEVPVAVAWLPRGQLEGFALWQSLALAFWNIRKEGECWESAECVEVIDRPDTLVDTADFRAVLAAVWPAAGEGG
jgi:hypothetical protein